MIISSLIGQKGNRGLEWVPEQFKYATVLTIFSRDNLREARYVFVPPCTAACAYPHPRAARRLLAPMLSRTINDTDYGEQMWIEGMVYQVRDVQNDHTTSRLLQNA